MSRAPPPPPPPPPPPLTPTHVCRCCAMRVATVARLYSPTVHRPTYKRRRWRAVTCCWRSDFRSGRSLTRTRRPSARTTRSAPTGTTSSSSLSLSSATPSDSETSFAFRTSVCETAEVRNVQHVVGYRRYEATDAPTMKTNASQS